MSKFTKVLDNMATLNERNPIWCEGVRCCESIYEEELDGVNTLHIHLVPWALIPLSDEIASFMHDHKDIALEEAPELHKELRALGDKMMDFICKHTWVFVASIEPFKEVMNGIKNDVTKKDIANMSEESLLKSIVEMISMGAFERGVPVACIAKLNKFYVKEVNRLFGVNIREETLMTIREGNVDNIPNLSKCFESMGV
jgi:hypothetical protein